MELEDVVMDGVMFLYKENIPSIKAGEIPPFVLLDIDNKTHENGVSHHTPHETS